MAIYTDFLKPSMSSTAR